MENRISFEQFDKAAQETFEENRKKFGHAATAYTLGELREKLFPESIPPEIKMMRDIREMGKKILEEASNEIQGKESQGSKLEDTVEGMLSDDYRERFIAEFQQAKIRYKKLKKFCNKIEAAQRKGTEEPKHDCPLDLLREQQKHMGQYLYTLEVRAEIEGIDLT